MWWKRPKRARAVLSDTPTGFEVRVPVGRSWWGIAFLPFWLTFWALGWGAVFYGLVTARGGPPPLFAIPWLFGWTAAGVLAFSWWLWLVSGREVVLIDGVRLRMRREVRGFARERSYELAAVRNLRFSPPVSPNARMAEAMPLFAFSGSIAFDVDDATHRFGMYMEEQESAAVVQKIVDRWPTLRGSAGAPGRP
jgi:hypothetical protein